jgi:hypothetical protein
VPTSRIRNTMRAGVTSTVVIRRAESLTGLMSP